jgi:NAD(P)-dependent dehydrogenase (short-subunit alcohol dehydrogenase family)
MTGSVAVVTGGGSGLGKEVSAQLVGDGYTVVVADIDAAAASAVASGLGPSARAVECDVTSAESVAAMVAVASSLGALKVLVLSAAIEIRSKLTETTDEDWQAVLDVNLKGPWLCMRAAIPAMVAAGGGSVIALGSTLGHIGSPAYAAYCTSKGALVNLCKQAAIEHAPDQVRVNVVSPSACESGLFLRVSEQAPDPAELRARIASSTPMGRLGSAADVCGAVSFLASDAASYLSGAVLPLDGGLAARRM